MQVWEPVMEDTPEPLDLINGWTESGEEIIVHKDFVYRWGKKRVLVPAGFTCDMASVPRLLWWLFPPFGPYLKAAVIHDYLYRTDGLNHESGKPWERREADWLFLQVMIESGTRLWRAAVMYRMVRWFGWRSWRKKKAEGIA